MTHPARSPSCGAPGCEALFDRSKGVETLKGDVERESAIELLGSGRAGLVCLMARGVWRAIKGPMAHV